MTTLSKGALIASAVAGLFGCASTTAASAPAGATSSNVVHCAGINSCKGQGSCAGADNSCKTQNSCKGKGWIEAPSAANCESQGGKVLASR